MLKPFDGFRQFKTDHCVTGSMRHIYDFHRHPVSEDLLLGLGEGVGFIYWHMKGMPPFLGGLANTGRPGEEGLAATAGRRTGVRVDCLTTGSAGKAEKVLLEALSHGPAMIQVDMGFLPYFDLPEDYHFGGHVVVVAGIDRDAGQVLVADRDESLHPVSLNDLAQARGSTHKPFPPKHALFAFDFSAKRSPTAAQTWQAIRKTVGGMLQPPISNLGVKGIRKASAAVRRWPKTLGDDELRYACFNASIFIDATGGTGVGLFRYMYGRFLSEAATITGESGLAAVGDQMRRIGDVWEDVARRFKQSSDPDKVGCDLAEAAGLLMDVADREERAWTRLDELSHAAPTVDGKGT